MYRVTHSMLQLYRNCFFFVIVVVAVMSILVVLVLLLLLLLLVGFIVKKTHTLENAIVYHRINMVRKDKKENPLFRANILCIPFESL